MAGTATFAPVGFQSPLYVALSAGEAQFTIAGCNAYNPGWCSGETIASVIVLPATPTATPIATATPSPTPAPPTIVRHPAGLSVNAGQAARFSVEANGVGPFAYQWFRNDEPLGGATGDAYLDDSSWPPDAGAYRCEVTGAGGTASSNPAALVVHDPPVANAAQFMDHSAPPQMEIGQELLIGVVLKNTSPLTWSAAQGYALAVTDDPANLFQGAARVYLSDPAQVIPPVGGFATFVAAIRAPAAVGAYSARVRMIEENVELFGDEATISISAVEPINAAAAWTLYE